MSCLLKNFTDSPIAASGFPDQAVEFLDKEKSQRAFGRGWVEILGFAVYYIWRNTVNIADRRSRHSAPINEVGRVVARGYYAILAAEVQVTSALLAAIH